MLPKAPLSLFDEGAMTQAEYASRKKVSWIVTASWLLKLATGFGHEDDGVGKQLGRLHKAAECSVSFQETSDAPALLSPKQVEATKVSQAERDASNTHACAGATQWCQTCIPRHSITSWYVGLPPQSRCV